MKETRKTRNIKTRKIKVKNKRLSIKNIKKYDMKPIYGGVIEEPKKEGFFTKLKNKVKDMSNREAQYIDSTNDAKMSWKEKLKNRSAITNFVTSPLLGLVRNTQSAANKLRSKPKDKDKDKPDTPVDVSKTIGDTVSSISTSVSKMTKQTMSLPEKTKIKRKLKELKDKHQINEKEYEHAVEQIDKPDSTFGVGIGSSIVSTMAPIQSVVKVIGDWFVNANNTDDGSDIQPRRTIIKLLKFPKASKSFVKGTLGKDGHEIADEFMVLTKDVFNTQGDKTTYDLNSVDNLLANVINGCIGPNCKAGRVGQKPVIEKVINIIDNQDKLDQLKILRDLNMKKIEDQEQENTSRMMNLV